MPARRRRNRNQPHRRWAGVRRSAGAWNVDHPERIEALHRSFIDAGADIILTNSFGGNYHRLKLHRSESRVAELNEAVTRIARRIADGAERKILVAGSMGPTGERFEGRKATAGSRSSWTA